MKKDSILNLLSDFGITDTQISGDNLRFPCPYRKHTHAGFGTDEGKKVFSMSLTSPHIGKCFVCNEVSTLPEMTLFLSCLNHNEDQFTACMNKLELEHTVLTKIDSAYDEMEARLAIAKKTEEDLGFLEEWFENLPVLSERAKDYLLSRNFDPFWVQVVFDIRFDPTESRIVFPVYSQEDNSFRGAHGRSIDPDADTKVRYYKGSKLSDCFISPMGPSIYSEVTTDILLVEGMFDVCRMTHHLWHCEDESISSEDLIKASSTCILGVGSNRLCSGQVKVLKRAFKPVHILLDNDESGINGARESCNKLKISLPFCQILSLPDDIKDPDEVSFDYAQRILNQIK